MSVEQKLNEIFDKDRVMEQVDGDVELLMEMVELFTSGYPELLSNIKNASPLSIILVPNSILAIISSDRTTQSSSNCSIILLLDVFIPQFQECPNPLSCV